MQLEMDCLNLVTYLSYLISIEFIDARTTSALQKPDINPHDYLRTVQDQGEHLP